MNRIKEFIKKWIMLFGLVSVSITVIPALISGNWEFASTFVQIMFALLVICLLQLFTDKISIRTPILKYLIDLGMTLSVVSFFGWIFKWFEPGYVWMMFVMVIPSYIVGAFLDLVKVKKDVDFINKQITIRRKKINADLGKNQNES